MDVFEVIVSRRSIRAFKPDPVSEELVDKILEAARWAPSAGNLQAREFILVKNPEVKRRLSRAALGQDFIEEAPIDIVVCADEEQSARRYMDRGRKLYCIQDAAASIENILLIVHALGLGACWIGAFEEEAVAETLNLPRGVRPVAIIPIGYPAEHPPAMARRKLREIVHINKYGEKVERVERGEKGER